MKKSIRIGGASGYWGDSDLALPQLLASGGVDYIILDYLAEITMSILARQRAKDPALGYATDFVSGALRQNLQEIARRGVKIIANAGGVNPEACGAAARTLIAAAGLPLKVAVIAGDDLTERARAGAFTAKTEMFSGAPFPSAETVASVSAYVGAFPIAAALDAGADIVITGRAVDSALALGAAIHAFGWTRDDLDRLAQGSLCGHILECGAQASGGNFTDWRDAPDMAAIGYPIATIDETGAFEVTKPEGSGGIVSVGTVGEQMLYEIGDPQAYVLPDAVCDFSEVRLAQIGPDRVRVEGAKGRPPTPTYKVCCTIADGFRAGTVMFFTGVDAAAKARAFAEGAIARARRRLRALNAPDFEETLVEVVGDGSVFGEGDGAARDVAVKIAAKHRDERAAGLILKEITGLALGGPPGLCGFAGGRPTPMPVLRLYSFLIDKSEVPLSISLGEATRALPAETGAPFDVAALPRRAPPEAASIADPVEVPLLRLAFARSGDKGDDANVGVLPRRPEFVPHIWAALSEEAVAARFAHVLKGSVSRYFLPGTGAINFVLRNALGGGGVASLRNDPQGKAFSQILLAAPIAVPRSLAETL